MSLDSNLNAESNENFAPQEAILKIPREVSRQLKVFGEPESSDPWNDYSSFEFTEASAQILIKILNHEYDENEDDENIWIAELHAWRILISKKYEPAIPTLIDYLFMNSEDDWAADDISQGLLEFGPVSLPLIFDEFKRDYIFVPSVYAYAALTEVLVEIARAFPSERDGVASFFREMLADFEVLPPNFNSFIISSLLDIKDIQALPTIERVFARDCLDQRIVDWKFVKSIFPDLNLSKKIVREKLDGNNISYKGDSKFQRLLNAVGANTSVEEVRLRILGLLLAIDYVQPSELADQIIREANEMEFGFQTEGQAEYFYLEFFGLWNEMTTYQSKIFRLLEMNSSKLSAVSELRQASYKLIWTQAQIEAFVDGFNLGNSDPRTYKDTMIYRFISFLEKKIEAGDSLVESDYRDIEKVNMRTLEIKNYWDENYLEFAKLSQKLRIEQIERFELIQANKEIGRNDPCPCGSGKKFKKCCLI